MAKAEELEQLAQQCQTPVGRGLFLRIAEGWRRSAKLAQLQVTLAEPAPPSSAAQS